MTKKFRVKTLGCRTNQYESQAYRDQLVAMGYSQAKEGERADLCIVNTCTVTESADSSSRHEIRQLARQNRGAKIVVTGCFSEQNPDAVRNIEGVSALIPNKDKEVLLEKILPDEEIPEFSIKNFDAHTRAFVKVQDGCNSFCTYCIIPYVRGRSQSRTVDEVVQEVGDLVANGYREIVLTGINIGDYDGGSTLAGLVRAVDNVDGVERLRLSSIDPDEVDDELMDAILSGKRTCPSMHIVLQSGSNVILKRMNRKYTRQMFFEAIDKMCSACSDFTFTTDIIVGFPGETEIDFEQTLDAMREVKFAKVHMFPYSDRPRTRSARMPNKVHPGVIRERKQQVLRLSEKIAYDLREQFLGRKMEVLTETNHSGHTENFLQVHFDDKQFKPNQQILVDLIENTPSGFLGVPCA